MGREKGKCEGAGTRARARLATTLYEAPLPSSLPGAGSGAGSGANAPPPLVRAPAVPVSLVVRPLPRVYVAAAKGRLGAGEAALAVALAPDPLALVDVVQRAAEGAAEGAREVALGRRRPGEAAAGRARPRAAR